MKSIEAIATELEAKGWKCDRDDTRYHPLKIWSEKGLPLAGIRFERGRWVHCLIWDDWLVEAGIDKGAFSQIIEKVLNDGAEQMPVAVPDQSRDVGKSPTHQGPVATGAKLARPTAEESLKSQQYTLSS